MHIKSDMGGQVRNKARSLSTDDIIRPTGGEVKGRIVSRWFHFLTLTSQCWYTVVPDEQDGADDDGDDGCW